MDLFQGLWPQKPGWSAEAQVRKCHEKCKTCHLFDYNQEWHCVECHAGHQLWVDGCFAPCPEGQYRYGYDCQNCTKNCAECAGELEHECLRCMPGFRLDFRRLCVRDCTDGFFSTLDGQSCGECNPYCKTCISGATISCKSCYPGYELRVLEPSTGTGECMQNCEKGFFRDAPNDLRCIQCAEYCADCDSLHTCVECVEGASLHRGFCYLVPNTAVRDQIDFEAYLQSGSGASWDPKNSPSWELLTGSR